MATGLHTIFHDDSGEDSDAGDASPIAPVTCGAEGSSDLHGVALDFDADPQTPNGKQSWDDVIPGFGDLSKSAKKRKKNAWRARLRRAQDKAMREAAQAVTELHAPIRAAADKRPHLLVIPCSPTSCISRTFAMLTSRWCRLGSSKSTIKTSSCCHTWLGN